MKKPLPLEDTNLGTLRGHYLLYSTARRANMSHYTAVEKCQKLVDFGLMESTTDKRNRTYTITEKGIQFFQEMQKFIEVAQAVKIRY